MDNEYLRYGICCLIQIYDHWSAIQVWSHESHVRQKNSLSKSTDRRFPSTHFRYMQTAMEKKARFACKIMKYFEKKHTKNRVQLNALHLMARLLLSVASESIIEKFNLIIFKPFYVHYIFHCVRIRYNCLQRFTVRKKKQQQPNTSYMRRTSISFVTRHAATLFLCNWRGGNIQKLISFRHSFVRFKLYVPVSATLNQKYMQTQAKNNWTNDANIITIPPKRKLSIKEMVNAIAQRLNADGFCVSTEKLRERDNTHWTIVNCS